LTYQQKTISSAPATIYNTNLSGVGVAVMAFTDSSQVFTDLTSTISSKSQSPAISAGQQQSMSMTFSYILLFVKTGPVAGGTVPTSALPKVNGSFGLSFCADGPACGVMTDVSTVQVGALNAGSGQIPFTVPTCQIDDVTVQMGTHDLSELPGKGQPLSSSTSFNLNLHDCSILNGVGGLYDFSSLQPSYSDGYNAIYYTITPVYGADDVYGAAGVMKLDAAAGSATGIGIQLSGNQTFSTATSFGSLNTAAAQLRKLSPGYAVTPMLYARYFQTSDAPTPGSANSKATITLSYR
jgi:type 1 fimbria pilin